MKVQIYTIQIDRDGAVYNIAFIKECDGYPTKSSADIEKMRAVFDLRGGVWSLIFDSKINNIPEAASKSIISTIIVDADKECGGIRVNGGDVFGITTADAVDFEYIDRLEKQYNVSFIDLHSDDHLFEYVMNKYSD